MHTKGPWKHEIWPNGQMTILSDAPDLESPCLSVVWTPSTKTGVNMYSERDDNARLIAAAPDLLTACKRAIPWLGKAFAEGMHEGCAMPNDLPACLGMLEAAIRKAEGKVQP